LIRKNLPFKDPTIALKIHVDEAWYISIWKTIIKNFICPGCNPPYRRRQLGQEQNPL
jgi:hypothetical protein